ncbi:calcineurin-like phosphoesterase C-terminal domain-containing protein [Thalassoroseus pseudoceratinae]|uniref:calcineurin-like phosphoesterase C-terminal domain-containing protein n=1 Tax=Thalassoroseus pseudoceratinae TaxID=2713176 RepID=UPI0014213278|nr:calcineurin-like phosphoesterase family protein [Thalassoroseus pseudoceratinae]
MRFVAIFIVPLITVMAFVGGVAQSEPKSENEPVQKARGVVFHDENMNGSYDEGEKTLADIRVSNGRDIVKTDEHGRYELPVGQDTIVFVVKPRSWRTPLSEDNLPRFYYIHKPKGSPKSKFPGVEPTGPLPESIDFPLYPQDEPEEFQAIMFGDPQPRNQEEVDFITHDVIEELVGTNAAFGVTLGDITFDNLSLFESQAQAIAVLGIPWYNVIGNHDINYDARHDRQSDETFERVFGPSYYSFDYGPVHFLVLDDIEWIIEGNGRGRYRGGLGAAQMEFIRKDLELIPDDQLVVLMMHIPLVNVRDRHELYRLIEQRPFSMSISAHEHIHRHVYIDGKDGWRGPKPHHHVVNVTVSGSWWSGAKDERGIPHTQMADGAPNGYSIVTFNGQSYEFEFRAAGRSANYQMQIHAPESVETAKLSKTDVFANVFNGSKKTKVELRVCTRPGSANRTERPWNIMTHTAERDPKYVETYENEKLLPAKNWRDMPKPKNSTHLWKSTLPANLEPGLHVLEVRATEANGRTFESRRLFRVIQSESVSE